MNTITNLLMLYGGILLINTIISIFLWINDKSKTSFYKIMFYIWFSSVVAFVFQGILQQNDLAIVSGFSFTLFTVFSLVFLFQDIYSFRVPIKRLVGFFVLSYGTTLFLLINGVEFVYAVLPLSFSIALPLLVTAYHGFFKQWNDLTFPGKGYIWVAVMFSIHILDFPFLRKVESAATLGFLIAILIVFGFSIFAPAMVIEILAKRQTRIVAEIDVAKKIQTEILPKDPHVPGMDLTCFMRPADEVGGDYYDIYSVDDKTWLFLGDVTGHGLGSGLVMFMAQSIITSILETNPAITPMELNLLFNQILFNNLERLNEKRPMALISLCFGKENSVSLSGNHDLIFVYRYKTKLIEKLALYQFPMGLGFTDIFDKSDIKNELLSLEDGDILFLGTDGITEAAKHGDVNLGMFGEDLLEKWLKENCEKTVDEMKKSLLETLDDYTSGKYFDDITFVIARLDSKKLGKII
ncbi:SpoIIE family protein phosphatase [bacterium]|nr:SpoIIE family protein phosphatase [bacterium]